MDNKRALAAVILAAGKGKRMGNPNLAKVLTPLNNTPLLGHVLQTCNELECERVVTIVGHQGDTVRDYTISQKPDARIAVQEQQLGTGHAVQQTESLLEDFDGEVVILSGDVPLLSASTLRSLMNEHSNSGAVLTVLSAKVPDATGYGRIVRGEGNALSRIVEHKDASDEELEIDEINSGVYIVDRRALFSALSKVKNANTQEEYYLTDIAGILNEDGEKVNVFVGPDWQELQGINTPDDLAKAAAAMEARASA